MAVDIGQELLLAVTEAFQRAYDKDVAIKVLEKRMDSGTLKGTSKAHLEDAARYSERVGELLANAYRSVVSSEALPNGKMYWNIAKKVIGEPLVNNYNLVAEASVKALDAVNAEQGVGLKAQKPAINQARLTNLMNKVADADYYDDVAFTLDEPVKNFSRSVVDDAVEANADFQAKAGLDVKIVRSTTGKETCDWCKRLAGTYDYADVRSGHDVWKRHAYCDCRIEYVSSKERYDVQNYKRITKAENREKIAKRKGVETNDDRAPEKIAARMALAGVGEEERARKHLLRDHPEIKVNWQTVNSRAYHGKFAAITGNEVLNENLYKAAKEILNHRDGLLQEDMYLLDAETGKVVHKQTASSEQQAVTYTKAMNKVVRANKGKLTTIHNHPQGMPPSASDMNSQHQHGYKTGVVVAHDGRVFVYETLDNFSELPAGNLSYLIASYKNDGYNEFEAHMKSLEALSSIYGFRVKEVVE